MSVLVIGGTGFVGTRLIELLASRGEDVICFDINPDLGKFSHLGDHVKTVVGDVTRIDDIIQSIKEYGVKRIINLAYVIPPESEEKLQLAVRVNLMGMNNVFEAARLTGIQRVVYASSSAVYGCQSSFGERAVTEEEFCHPALFYASHKLWNEEMAKRYADRYGIIIVGLRMATVSGPGRTRGIMGWSGKYIDDSLRGNPVQIPFRSNQKVLLIYVDDISEIFIQLCFSEGLKYPIYNSFGYSIVLRELAEMVRKVLPNAQIRFNEEAPDPPLVYNWSSERVEKELQMKFPPIEEMVRRHFERTRREASLKA